MTISAFRFPLRALFPNTDYGNKNIALPPTGSLPLWGRVGVGLIIHATDAKSPFVPLPCRYPVYKARPATVADAVSSVHRRCALHQHPPLRA